MSQVINDWEDLIEGMDGKGGITKSIEKAIDQGNENGVRVKVVFRTQEQGTPTMTKLSELRFDPKTAQLPSVKRSIIQTLEDNPGGEFSGKIRIDFQNGDDSTNFSSFQRTVKMGSAAQFDPGNDEEESGNFAEELLGGGGLGMSGTSRDEIIEHYKGLLAEKDNAIKRQAASTDAAMGFLFKSQANMLAMFDRSTRMMESYTLRFGFPQMQPQIIETGSVNREPPQATGGGGGMGMLPMLLQAAAQFAKGDSPAQAPAAQPQPQQRQISRSPGPGPSGRMEAVSQGAGAVRAMRPQPAQPAGGFEAPPPLQEDRPMMGHQEMMQEDRPRGQRFEAPEQDYEEDVGDEGDGGDYEEDDPGAEDAATQQLNQISPDEMKALVLNWVNASPENKQAALGMGSELMSAIMG
jgi:hypothetical protein